MMTDATEHAFAALVDFGMHPDRDLLQLFDLEAFARRPEQFLRDARTKCAFAFKQPTVGPIDPKALESSAGRRAYMTSVEHERRDAAKSAARAALSAMGDVRQMSDAEYAEAKRLLMRGC